MSAETPKPVDVDAPVVAPTITTTEAPVSTDTPAVASTESAAESATETSAIVEPAAEEEVVAPPKEEVKPVEEGVLGYKGPGLLKSFIFQKKFFWFGTDAVEHKSLASYLRGEKDTASANHNAAWASHTGHGFLFFSKKATDKTPAGLFNLSDVADITEEGTDFHFVSGGHKHGFQATSVAERENWVTVLKTKVEEAKTLSETIKDTEEYKNTLATLSPPLPTPAVKKVEEPKDETPAAEPAKEEKKELTAEKNDRKSRSASRKRASIFGGFGSKKKEEESVAPAVEEPAVGEASVEPTAETPVVVEPVAPEESAAPVEPTPAPKPTPTKRNSIFGTLKSQFSNTKEKKSETPVTPAKDEVDPVSETAPVIPQVESTEPLAATTSSEVAPAEAAAPVTNGETKVEAPVTKAEKRKSSLPWLSKKEKPASDEEGDREKPKSPFAKLRATVKGKKPEKVAETKPEDVAEAAPAEESVDAPAPADKTTAPQVTASA